VGQELRKRLDLIPGLPALLLARFWNPSPRDALGQSISLLQNLSGSAYTLKVSTVSQSPGKFRACEGPD